MAKQKKTERRKSRITQFYLSKADDDDDGDGVGDDPCIGVQRCVCVEVSLHLS